MIMTQESNTTPVSRTGVLKRYDEHPDGGGMREDVLGAYALFDEAEDKIEGLSADLDSAVEVAYRRGAIDWVRLNYPSHFARLSAKTTEEDR